MSADRLERAVQQMHGIGMSLMTVVVAAIGADKASSSFALGELTHGLLYASLACFIASAIAGGHLITRLPLLDGEVDEVMARRAALIGRDERGLLPFTIGVWRGIQHWGLIAAILLGVAGGLATVSAEELPSHIAL